MAKTVAARMIYQTEETRLRILAKARRLFTKRDLFGVQMKDVAEAVGISRTSLYRYFRDKEDLAAAILGELAGEMTEAWETSPERAAIGGMSGLEALGAYFRGYWLCPAFKVHQRFMAEFDAYYSGSRLPADFKKKVTGVLGRDHDAFAEACIERGIADGSVRPGLDPHLAAVTILNAARSLQQRLILRGEALIEARPGDLEKMCGEHLDYMLAGIAAERRKG